MENNFILDLDDIIVSTQQTIGIVLSETGVKYTAQCGGVGCWHPVAEGFAIFFGDFAQDFDDCKFGCHTIGYPENKQARSKLGLAFQEYCNDYLKKNKNLKYSIHFDFSEINETIEGWIPAIITGMFDEWNECYFDNCKIIIHAGNCD